MFEVGAAPRAALVCFKARQDFVHREADGADEVLYFVGLDGDRRNEKNRITQRADDEPMAACGQGDLETGAGIGRPAFSGGGLELDGAGEAELTEGADVRMTGEGGGHFATEQRGALDDLTRGQHGL